MILPPEVISILLGAPAAAAACVGIYRWRKSIRVKRKVLENKRDETLTEVAELLKEIGGDVRCLYASQVPQLEALEISLMALKGEDVNGNIKIALKKVQAAKQAINARLTTKVGGGNEHTGNM